MSEPQSDESRPADWVQAAGVSGEPMVEDKPPRLHWALIVAGPIGLACAVVLSMWSSSRRVEHSVDVQVDARWQAGERLALRTQVLGGDLRPYERALEVDAALLDDQGVRHELGSLTEVGTGLAQAELEVPALPPGSAELHLRYQPEQRPAFEEVVAIELVEARAIEAGEQVIVGSNLQWADDTDPQPQDVRIDLRFAGRVVAGFRNHVFVRVTDVQGKPWAPKDRPAEVQVRLLSGEWTNVVGKTDDPPIVHEGPLDRLGLADFSGVLTSDVVRFEVRLPAADPPPAVDPPLAPAPAPAPPTPAAPAFAGPKRALRFVSHAGTVHVMTSQEFARPGDTLKVEVEAISGRKPVFVDVHAPDGSWIASFTPPLIVPQDREWTIPATLGEGFLQFESYQSVSSPEDSAAIARVQIAAGDRGSRKTLDPLIERQREQLALPRTDKQFDVARERAYLDALAAAKLDPEEVMRARSFLIGSLEPVVFGPPVALDTRAREVQTLADSQANWVLGIRWFLFGGGGLFIGLLAALVWRHQSRFEAQSNRALGLGAGESALDDETFADQSLAITRARQEILVRGAVTIGIMIAMLIITIMMLESLVWS
ncbi:hypothetical protein ACNOYE_11020 [Nannocystaceae bacterium ST9]